MIDSGTIGCIPLRSVPAGDGMNMGTLGTGVPAVCDMKLSRERDGRDMTRMPPRLPSV